MGDEQQQFVEAPVEEKDFQQQAIGEFARLNNVLQEQAAVVAQLVAQNHELRQQIEQQLARVGRQQPSFVGKPPPLEEFAGGDKEKIDNWLRQIEKNFACWRPLPEDEIKLLISLTLFKGTADDWWAGYQRLHPEPITYEDFKRLIREQFHYRDDMQDARRSLQTWTREGYHCFWIQVSSSCDENS
jgi:hypothetical protein